MKNNRDRLLFASLDIELPNKTKMLNDLLLIPDSAWIGDVYRKTHMLPLMTKSGGSTLNNINQLPTLEHSRDFSWTSYAPKSIIEYFEQYVFTWLRPRPRVMILKTPPGGVNAEHIDCLKSQFHTRQHKFRVPLSGNTDSLYFITDSGLVRPPRIQEPFIMDGSWPHGMINDSADWKITICAGSPWFGSDAYPPFKHSMYSDNLRLPEDYEKYFNSQDIKY